MDISSGIVASEQKPAIIATLDCLYIRAGKIMGEVHGLAEWRRGADAYTSRGVEVAFEPLSSNNARAHTNFQYVIRSAGTVVS